MYNTIYNWEYLAKNFNGVSIELIDNKALLKLNKHILVIRYLEKGAFCFTQVTKDDEKTNEDCGKAETVFNSEKKIEKNKALRKRRRIYGLYHLQPFVYLHL